MRCPNCGSDSCFIITETDYKGYGFFRGCLGWLLFGPIGALCGACGMGQGKSRTYWQCHHCRRKFRG